MQLMRGRVGHMYNINTLAAVCFRGDVRIISAAFERDVINDG